MTAITHNGFTLRHKESGEAVQKGEEVTNFRGAVAAINGGTSPHHEGSTGRIWTDCGEFYPSVFDLVWTK